MRKMAGIVRYTFIEIFRNKVYYVLLLFAGALIGCTLLLGSLGGEQKNRMILDLGLAGIEVFSLVIAVFAAVTLVSEEAQSRTLYLILTRPVSRASFIAGRFLGLISILSLSFILMAAAHLILMKCASVPWDHFYFLSLYYSWEKIVLITAIALVFSLFSTSTVSAVTFTFFFWVMGHLSLEMKYLSQQTAQPLAKLGCRIFYYVAPNFQTMNLLDYPDAQIGAHALWAAVGYGFCYTAASLMIAVILFSKKEF